MKTYWRVELLLHILLTSALDGGEWSASHPDCFTPPGKKPNTTLLIRIWVDTRAGVDAVVKRKILAPSGNLTKVVQPVA
jgi:hypothetical protein